MGNAVFADGNYSGLFFVTEEPAASIDAKNQWQSTTRFNPQRDEPLLIKTTPYQNQTNVDFILVYPDRSEYALKTKASLMANVETTFGFAGRVNNAFVPAGGYQLIIRYNNNSSRVYDDCFEFTIYYDNPSNYNTPTPQFTITFNSTGGTAISPITQYAGTSISPPISPTRSGYTFSHWIPSIPQIMPSSNLTITAQWIANPVPITSTPSERVGIYWFSKLKAQGHQGDYLTNPQLNWNDKNLDKLVVRGYTGQLKGQAEIEVIEKWGCFVTAYANMLRNAGAISIERHVDFREGLNSPSKNLTPDPFTITMANIAHLVSQKSPSGWPKIIDNGQGGFLINDYTGASHSSVTWFNTAIGHFKNPSTGKTYDSKRVPRGEDRNGTPIPLRGYLSALTGALREHKEGIVVKLEQPGKMHMVVFQSYSPDFLNYIATGNPNGLDPTRGVTWVEYSNNPINPPITIEPVPGFPVEILSAGNTSDNTSQENLSGLNQYNWARLNTQDSFKEVLYIDENSQSTSISESAVLNQNQGKPMEAFVIIQENATKDHTQGYNKSFDQTWSYISAGYRFDHITFYEFLTCK